MAADLWIYLSLPLVSALVGWATNVIAIKMTFYPLEFRGKAPYLGWQGIIPAKAAKMADKAVDLMTSKLITPGEVFARIDPNRFVWEIEPAVHDMLDEVINEVMREESPTMWELLPKRIKQDVVYKAKVDAGGAITQMMEDIRCNVDGVFDLKGLVHEALVRDKQLLNEIFLQAGAEEFKFIERSGLYLGFAFGLMQAVAWHLHPAGWTLPIAGFIVGYVTNWLALQLIFRPLQPVKIGSATVQGLFLKRQAEVAERYAALISAEILSTRNIINALVRGPLSDRLFAIIERHVRVGVDLFQGVSRSLVQLTLGKEGLARAKARVGEQIMKRAIDPLKHVERYAEEAMDIENTIRTKLEALPPEEFEGLLRPVFQEDEWKLIVVGGVLGAAVGVMQAVFLTL